MTTSHPSNRPTGDGPKSAIIVTCPVDADAALSWWHIAGGQIIAYGQDYRPPEMGERRVIALLPAGDTMVRRWTKYDMTVAQAETAARLEMAAASIGPDIFVATKAHRPPNDRIANHPISEDISAATNAVEVLTVAIAHDILAARLAALMVRGLDADAIIPIGCILPDRPAAIDLDDLANDDLSDHPITISGRFGDLGVLRHGDLIMPYSECAADQNLVDQLLSGAAITSLDQAGCDAALLAAAAMPPINLRQAAFAKRRPRFAWNSQQKRTALVLAACLLILSLMIPLVQIAKLHMSADSIESAALAQTQAVIPAVQTLGQAEQQLDSRLAARGLGNAVATAPISGLYSNIQSVKGVTLRELRYRSDGLVSAIAVAPKVDDLNAMLLALQQNGYIVTATQRSDTTGSALADITVRAP